MRTVYEWTIEITDENGDIIESEFSDKLIDLPELEGKQEIGLVRRTGDEANGENDRMWSYVKDGKLPEFFANSLGHVTDIKVPKRFQEEFKKHVTL